jgi:hypothetical protein
VPAPQQRLTALFDDVRHRRAERLEREAKDPVGAWLAQQPARLIVEAPDRGPLKRVLALLRVALPGIGLRVDVEPLFDAVADPDPWGLRPYWLITLPMSRGEVGATGHEVAYELAELDGVEDAVLEAVLPRVPPGAGRVPVAGETPLAVDYPVGSSDLPWVDRHWALRRTRFDDAHREGLSGTGVRISHPDTGWAHHPELDLARLDLEHDVNLVPGEGPSSALDRLDDSFGLFPGHGTGTGSVIVSGHTAGDVFGAAPAATLVPARCMASVIYVNSASVARAVFHACENDAHVVSMSLGGMPARALERVVKKAVYEHDIVFCAAAGNKTWFTAFPGSYPEAICVAASTASDRPFVETSHGFTVDVSAPGARVWAADFDKQRRPIVIAGGGTSYATPHVASAAALWLEKHGRDALIARYRGEASLSEVFKHLLTKTAHDPGRYRDAEERHDRSDLRLEAWDPSEYGAGVLDTAELLAAPLPSVAEVAPVPRELRGEKMPREEIVRVLAGADAPPERRAEVELVVDRGEKRFTSEVLQRLGDARAGASRSLLEALGA